MISRLRPWKATIAVWFAALALVVAPSVVRAHSADGAAAWSEISAVVAAPAVHVATLRRAETDARGAHSAAPSFAALPASRVSGEDASVAAPSAALPLFHRAAAGFAASGYDATAPPVELI